MAWHDWIDGLGRDSLGQTRAAADARVLLGTITSIGTFYHYDPVDEEFQGQWENGRMATSRWGREDFEPEDWNPVYADPVKPRLTDEECFPLVLDRDGDLYQASVYGGWTVSATWSREGRGEFETLDELDQRWGPLTRVEAS